MRHTYFGKKLSRTTDQRKQLLRNLACDLIKHGQMKTTKAKAIAVRAKVEKLITRAKKGNQFAYRLVLAELGNATAAKQLVEDAKLRFSGRNSGYTRILRFGLSGSDARDLVQLSFVDPRIETEVIKPVEKKDPTMKKAVTKKLVRNNYENTIYESYKEKRTYPRMARG
ncbi:MAG: 50S ribosomal protein L17 [Candidatus Gottesmanbacteria bacterium]